MQWLLDTCVVSEMVRSSPHHSVIDWVARNAALSGLSIVTLGELQYGIERMAPGRRRNTLQLWFDGLCGQYEGRTLAADTQVWRTFARLKASLEVIGRPQSDFDVLIAATATVHQLTLVTRNVRHFQDAGVPMFDPWAAH